MNAVKDPDVAQPSKALLSITLREHVEEMLHPFMEEFVDFIPELAISKHTYAGRWIIGVRTGGGRGDPNFSRLDFELVVNAEEHEVAVTAKSTTHNKDHPLQTTRVTDDEAGMSALGDFFETAFLLFAGRYFERAVKAI